MNIFYKLKRTKMDKSTKKIVLLVIGLSIGLLFMGMLRKASIHPNMLTPLSGLATPGYVLISVLFTIWLVRAGLPLNKYGFGAKLNLKHITLAVIAIIVLRVFAYTLNIAILPIMDTDSMDTDYDLLREE